MRGDFFWNTGRAMRESATLGFGWLFAVVYRSFENDPDQFCKNANRRLIAKS
jgi:hypothetical protein